MQHKAADNRPLAFIGRYLWRHRVSQGIVLLAVLGASASSVGARYSMKFLVDAMAAGPHAGAVWRALAIFVIFIGGDFFLWRVAGYAAAKALPHIGAELRLDLFRHLIGHSARYFNERFSGALASRVTAAATALYTVANGFIWNVLPPAAGTIGALVALGAVQWQMAAALTLAAAVIATGIGIAAARGRVLHHVFADRAASVAGEIIDVVANHATVRMFGGAGRETSRLAEAIGGEAAAQRNALQHIERLRLAHAAAVWAVSGVTLAWGVWLWQQGRSSAGDVVVCGSVTLALLQASRDFAVALVEMSHHWSRVGEAIETLMVAHDMPDGAELPPLLPERGAITLEAVSFQHADGDPVLDKITLRIPAGQRVGIAGPSGVGKSTLLALIRRLYPVDSGQVLIDGQDVATLAEASLGSTIAMVPQEISLFHRSILENIRYGRPEACDAEVRAAARAACCEEFIANLPEGYATLAGERGTRLSSGQKQRIAIARALLADAPIILLDEATSALDIDSEIAVQRAIGALACGRTILAVAHRLATIAGFDRILVIEGGRIVEDGAPAELRRRRGGHFARLWQAQQDEINDHDHSPALAALSGEADARVRLVAGRAHAPR
jgi:ATP-binding cassette subfamily B protein